MIDHQADLEQIISEIVNDKTICLQVPTKLSNPDILIRDARERNKDARLDIRVSSKNVDRALCFMDALIKALKARGHEVEVSWKTYVKLYGEVWEGIKLREVGFTQSPTGKFYFCAGIGCHRRWADGKEPIEGKLALIIATLEFDARRLIKIWEDNRLREKKEEERRLIQRELQVQKEQELHKFRALLQRARRWQDTQLMRGYIAYVEVKATQTDKLTPEFESWILWAKSKIDWYDPDTETDDHFLNDVDRDTLQFKKDR